MSSSNGIGTALRNARTARGMSLNDVATDAGISVATLSRIETDKQNVDVPLLITLAGLLHVTPAALLDGEGALRVDPATLAHDLASLSSGERGQVIADALEHARGRGHSRQALEARVDSLLVALDLVEDELRALQRGMKKRPAR